MNNKIFYQHPNLMRALGMHETVMEVMVNVLGDGESKVTDTFKFTVIICAIKEAGLFVEVKCKMFSAWCASVIGQYSCRTVRLFYTIYLLTFFFF